MTDLDNQLEQILSAADRERATQVAGQEWDSLYPSLRGLREARAECKTPHCWDEDPRTLTSALYPSMRRKP
jgi:hypothetical protein